jgi:hypothetical protein
MGEIQAWMPRKAALLSEAFATFRAECRPVRDKARFKTLVRSKVSIWYGLVLMVERDKAFFDVRVYAVNSVA